MRDFQPKKHKNACHQCNASKVKCPGGGLPCKRCADTSQPCHYSLAKRVGKPPGNKNRKTPEKLRQAEERNLEDSGSSVVHNDGSRNNSDRALNVDRERLERDDTHDPAQMPADNSFWPLSPLIDYSTFPDSSQFMPASKPNFLEGDHSVTFGGSDRPTLHSADPDFSDISGIHERYPQRPRAKAPEDCWDLPTFPHHSAALTDPRASLQHQALPSNSLQILRTQVCSILPSFIIQ